MHPTVSTKTTSTIHSSKWDIRIFLPTNNFPGFLIRLFARHPQHIKNDEAVAQLLRFPDNAANERIRKLWA
jgi:hypothetical protein